MGSRTVLAALALALVATQAAPAAPAPSLFPLAAGNRWTLTDLERRSSATISVATTRSPGMVLRGFPGAAELRVRAVGSTIEAWDAGSDRWEPFLRLGATAGTKYLVNLSQTPLWRGALVTVASRQAVVEDARGKTLRGCIRLTIRPPKNLRDAGIEELAFAPGIGLVRVSELTIAGVRERVLSSYVL